MFEFGFPWLGLVNGIRSNDSDNLDFMWAYCLPWFRATSKTQYGPMAVHVIFFNELMSDEIRGIWHAYRTASLMGHCGRNVAWDYILERMNCEFKDGLHGCVTRERLDKFGVMMNGFKHIDAMLSQSWGVEHPDDPSQYTHVKSEDVDAVVKQLEDRLGANRAEVDQKASARNPFGNGTMPWAAVDTAKVDLDDFIRLHLHGLQTDEPMR